MGHTCRMFLVGCMDSGSALMDHIGPSGPIHRNAGAVCKGHSQLLDPRINSSSVSEGPTDYAVYWHDQLDAAGSAGYTNCSVVLLLSTVTMP